MKQGGQQFRITSNLYLSNRGYSMAAPNSRTYSQYNIHTIYNTTKTFNLTTGSITSLLTMAVFTLETDNPCGQIIRLVHFPSWCEFETDNC